MNISAIKMAGQKVFGRSLAQTKRYSPEILTVVGIAGVVTAGVLAAKATLSLEDVVDKGNKRLEAVREEMAEGESTPRKLSAAYSKNAIDVVKLYGPAVTLGAASIACIVGAHGIMRKRNVALVAAYNVLEKSYSNYRQRVVEELGEEKDRDFHLGVRDEEVVTNEKTGKKETVKVAGDPNKYSSYARFFDEGNSNWEKDPEHNLFFLKSNQNYLNDLLRVRGHVFLNEVYDALGIERCTAGQAVGWIISDEGDNYIDFGIYEVRNRDFVNGNERAIILDFNVDGVIIDKI